MTWVLHFDGDERDVDWSFHDAEELASRSGLPEDEIADIRRAKALVIESVKRYGRVSGDASGHWINFGKDDPRNAFGAMSVSVRKGVLPEAIREE
jgi:hypothetical protein